MMQWVLDNNDEGSAQVKQQSLYFPEDFRAVCLTN